MRNTVRGSGNTGSVRDGGDGTEGFGRWGISDDGTVGSVDTDGVLVLAFARFECTVLSVVGCIVGTADTIVDVLAELGSVRAFRVADFEAEGVTTHEARKARCELNKVKSIKSAKGRTCAIRQLA